MSARATNLAIFALVLAELASGVGGYLAGGGGAAWVTWAHHAGGLALVALLGWKWRIVARSFARRGAGAWAAPSLLLGALFLATLATGLLWTLGAGAGLAIPGYGEVRPLALHATLGALLAIPFVPHAVARWPRSRPADLASRRALLRAAALGAAGFVLWRGVEAVAAVTGPGRRFTGSREEASFAGNAHPVTNWLGDRTRRIDAAAWTLRVGGGEARAPYRIGLGEIEAAAEGGDGGGALTATLDCTGGWYTTQRWTGAHLGALLDRAGAGEGARSVAVRSATGYWRRFPIGEARGFLLATRVGGERLSAGHGAPARLVAPRRRGYDWVKWVEEIEVSALPPWWQPPLPLQ